MVNSLAKKSNILNNQYTLDNSSVLQTECLKYLGVLIDQKTLFSSCFFYSHTMKYLALLHSIAFSLLIIDGIWMLYTAFGGSKLEYAPISAGSYNYILGSLTLIL